MRNLNLTIWVRMDRDLKERIEVQMARENRTSMAEMIRHMCKTYVDQHKTVGPRFQE